jgi:hypothetical protein
MTSSSQRAQAGSCSPAAADGGGGSISVMSSCSSLGTVTRQLFHNDAAAPMLGPSPRGPTLEDWGGAVGRSKSSMSAGVLHSGRNLISTPRERVSRSTGKMIEAEGSELSAAVAKVAKARSRSASPRGGSGEAMGDGSQQQTLSGRALGGQLERGFSLELQASWCSDMVTPREAVEVEHQGSEKDSAGSSGSLVPKLNLAAITGSDQQHQHQQHQQQASPGTAPLAGAPVAASVSSIAVQTSNRSSTRDELRSVEHGNGATPAVTSPAAVALGTSASSSTRSCKAADATASWQSYQALAAPAAAVASPRGLEIAGGLPQTQTRQQITAAPAESATGGSCSRLQHDKSFQSASSASLTPRTELVPIARQLVLAGQLSSRGTQSCPPAGIASPRGNHLGSAAASSGSSRLHQAHALPAGSPFSPRSGRDASSGTVTATAATALVLPRASSTPDSSRQLSPRAAATAAAATTLLGSQSPKVPAAANMVAAIVSQGLLGSEAAAAPGAGVWLQSPRSATPPSATAASTAAAAEAAAAASLLVNGNPQSPSAAAAASMLASRQPPSPKAAAAAAAASASMLASVQPQSPRAAAAAAAIAQMVTSQLLGVESPRTQSAPASPRAGAVKAAIAATTAMPSSPSVLKPAASASQLGFGSYDGGVIVPTDTASGPALTTGAGIPGRAEAAGPAVGSLQDGSAGAAAVGTPGLVAKVIAGQEGAGGGAGASASSPRSPSPRAKLAELQRRLVVMAVEKATLERQVQQGKQQAEVLQQEVRDF